MDNAMKQLVEHKLDNHIVAISELGGSPRSVVWRVTLQDMQDKPPSVIVKQILRPEWDKADTSLKRYINEYTALQFLNDTFPDDERPIPTLYDYDHTHKMLIMEDMQDGMGLHEIFMGNDRHVAENAVASLGRNLGLIHVRSYGQHTAHDAIGAGIGDYEPVSYPAFIDGWRLLCDVAGLDEPSDFAAEMQLVQQRLQDAPMQTVLIHSDPCPDNLMWIGGQTKLIDFETSRFDNPFFDVAYLRGNFPSCWCTGKTPQSIIDQFEANYRQAFATVYPQILDDAFFYPLLLDSIVYMLGGTFGWTAKMARDDWSTELEGIATARQRLLYRLKLVVDESERLASLPILRQLCRDAIESLHIKWGITPDENPSFPAYTEV